MRQMKDSGIPWIGEIPADWETIKLQRISRFKTGGTPPKSIGIEENGEIPWVTPSDISNYIITTSHRYITKEAVENNGYFLYPPNSVLVVCIASVGKMGLIDKYSFSNQQITALYNIAYNEKYVLYCLLMQADNLKVEANKNVVPIINTQILKSLFIPSPSKMEQQKIVDYLDDKCSRIDGIIEREQQLIEKFEEYKQSLITETVIKGLNHKVLMKDSNISWIGEIPSHWKITKLGYIGRLQNGISKSAKYFGSGNPFLSYKDVYKNYEVPQKLDGLVQSTEQEQINYSIKKGDIFFTRTSETIEEIGFSSVCNQDVEKGTFAGFLIRLRPYKDIIDIGYSKYYFRSMHHRFYLAKEMNLVTRASLAQGLLRGMDVLLPSIEEQQEIASFLDEKCSSIDATIARKESLIEKLQAYKKSLIYEVVTGKREV